MKYWEIIADGYTRRAGLTELPSMNGALTAIQFRRFERSRGFFRAGEIGAGAPAGRSSNAVGP